MHTPKKKNSLAICTKLSMCSLPPRLCPISRWTGDSRRRGGSEKIGSNVLFYTMQRINPLGSTVSITSMLYCIYRLILLLWV
ncbi:unnamed protein product [Staurois parvus]|uniref:Uncharacterized protein n=1 Tax=Staurois parvus TaxID=386267 RepID=A0ABN9BQM1_9NEOB|nr:unnamed protein product [Staurois parvus]